MYDKIKLKPVEAMAAVGNDAAHNNPDLNKSDDDRFKRELVSYLERDDAPITPLVGEYCLCGSFPATFFTNLMR